MKKNNLSLILEECIKNETEQIHGDSTHLNINRTGYFYHVTQQCWNHKSFFSFESARYRDYIIKHLCTDYSVIPLLNIIMPTHTHDVFYSKDVKNIQKVFLSSNSKISKFIASERALLFNKDTPRVFQQRPSYTVIEDRTHLFNVFYYLYHNADYLYKSGKTPPYSCFEEWQKGNFGKYKILILEQLFNLEISELLEICRTMDKETFHEYGIQHYSKFSKSDKNIFFKSQDPL